MFTRYLSLLSLACLILMTGCSDKSNEGQPVVNGQTDQSKDDHPDPHDVPLTQTEIDELREKTASWPAAIEHIQKYRDTIKTETTSGTPAKAHRSLDLLDHVLQWLPEIAQNSAIDKSHWQTIGEMAQQLRDAVNKVHANIDAGSDPDYESVSADIDAAVDALAAVPVGEAGDAGPQK